MDPSTQPSDRLAAFLKMAEADPTNELAHFSLGKIYFEGRDFARAETSLRRTLELNPRHSVAHRILGQVLMETGRRDDAIEVLRRGVGLAHEKGEFQPRNQMQEILRSMGVIPPDPARNEVGAKPTSAGSFLCGRCGKSNPALDEAPFDSDLGQRILKSICQSCWREWIAMSIKVINEYRLNLATDQGSKVFDFHMKEFLGIHDEAG